VSATTHADRTTTALLDAMKRQYGFTILAGRDMQTELKAAAVETDIIMAIGRVASVIIAVEHLEEVCKRAAEAMRGALHAALSETNPPGPIAMGNGVSVGLVNKPDKLVIDDEKKIPERYWEARDPALDKDALKRDLKNGPILGAHLVPQNDQTLRISIVKQKEAA
jgi:hypothetical protein